MLQIAQLGEPEGILAASHSPKRKHGHPHRTTGMKRTYYRKSIRARTTSIIA